MKERCRKNCILILKLMPVLLPFGLLFFSSIFFTLYESFTPRGDAEGSLDFLWAYKMLFEDFWFTKSFFFSLYTAFFSALSAVVLSVLISYFIWKLPFSLQKYTIVYKISLILPHITSAFIILLLFSKSGFFSSLLYITGLISDQQDFPSLIYTNSGIDIILAYIVKETPFAVLMVYSVLRKLDMRIIETAVMLGGSKFMIFRKIILPHLLPIIHTTFIILFLYSFGAFDIPYVLGGSYPGMVSIRVYNYYFKRDFAVRPAAMAMLVLILLFSIFFIVIYSRITMNIKSQERKL